MAILRNSIHNEYFDWMYDMVCENRLATGVSYRLLLGHLHRIHFKYLLPMDSNREADGVSLRYRYARHMGYEDNPEYITDVLNNPCSVLEMMVALAIRCETDIMDDPQVGNRMTQWFWIMLRNLGIGYMSDDRYDENAVDNIIDRFLNRQYSPDGKGGLFLIDRCDCDLRTVEIWHQMCWYLDRYY